MKNKAQEMTVRELASIGGQSRAKKLSSARQSQIGRKAVRARWARYYAKQLQDGKQPQKKRNKHNAKRNRNKNAAA